MDATRPKPFCRPLEDVLALQLLLDQPGPLIRSNPARTPHSPGRQWRRSSRTAFKPPMHTASQAQAFLLTSVGRLDKPSPRSQSTPASRRAERAQVHSDGG